MVFTLAEAEEQLRVMARAYYLGMRRCNREQQPKDNAVIKMEEALAQVIDLFRMVFRKSQGETRSPYNYRADNPKEEAEIQRIKGEEETDVGP